MQLATRRFLLRDFEADDGAAFLVYQEDREHASGLLRSFAAWAAERPRRNYQLAAVQRAEARALVGCCGLRQLGAAAGTAEFGIELAPAYRGRHGYAVEIADALLRFGFETLNLREIVGRSGNARIHRLAHWFGASGSPEAGWRLAPASLTNRRRMLVSLPDSVGHRAERTE